MPNAPKNLLMIFVLGLGLITGRAEVSADEKAEFVKKIKRDIREADRATRNLEQKIRQTPNDPELLSRLADSLIRRADLEFYLVIETEAGNQAYQDETVIQLRKKAIGVLREILNKYPDFQSNDRIMLSLAARYRELGSYEEAISTWYRLSEKYPNSAATIEALMALGNYYFDRNELDRAAKHYREILKKPESPISNFARYKLGWLAINRDQWKQARRLFEQVIRTQKNPTSLPSARRRMAIDLRAEALDGLAFCYVEAGSPEVVLEYFQQFKLSRREAVRVFSRLARRYYILEKHRPALKLYRHLMELSADPADRKLWGERIRELERQ